MIPILCPCHRLFLSTLLAILTIVSFSSCASRGKVSQAAGNSELLSDLPLVLGPDMEARVSDLLSAEVSQGNSVKTLNNGAEIFPAMLGAIRNARTSIDFCTYVYWTGDVADEMATALAERSRAGVRVRVLLDDHGSAKMEDRLVETMQANGIDVVRYNPVEWWRPAKLVDFNYRTHRKILVVDDRVGFTGGVGIAEEWEGDANSPEEWRDLHFEIRGPAVAQLRTAFAENWNESVPENQKIPLELPASAPATDTTGAYRAQVFSSSPSEGADGFYKMLHATFAQARDSIRIITPYFVLDGETSSAMTAAARRGVDITVIIPGPHIDMEFVQSASRASWGPLLKAGVKIYAYQPTMIHTKLLIVDGLWVSVGSANLDNRSFHLNDETNLNVYDRSFAAEQEQIFRADLANSKRVTYEEWQQRPLKEKFVERISSLMKSQY